MRFPGYTLTRRFLPERVWSVRQRHQNWRRHLREIDLFYKIELMTRQALGTLELAILLTVARLGDDAYGLAVRWDLGERTGRDYSVGAVYTTLQRLEEKGFLASHSSDPLPIRGGRSRRHFTLTGAGAHALREAERHAASVWSGFANAPLQPNHG